MGNLRWWQTEMSLSLNALSSRLTQYCLCWAQRWKGLRYDLSYKAASYLLTSEFLQPLTSFCMTVNDLTKLKVMFIGFIGLKPNSKERIVETTFLGQNELWSSANLYCQLHVLESLIPRRVC